MSTPTELPDEEDGVEFWDADPADSLEDLVPAGGQFSGARPYETLISLRMPSEVIAQMQKLASAEGLGYPALIRRWVAERLAQETAGDAADAAPDA